MFLRLGLELLNNNVYIYFFDYCNSLNKNTDKIVIFDAILR